MLATKTVVLNVSQDIMKMVELVVNAWQIVMNVQVHLTVAPAVSEHILIQELLNAKFFLKEYLHFWF